MNRTFARCNATCIGVSTAVKALPIPNRTVVTTCAALCRKAADIPAAAPATPTIARRLRAFWRRIEPGFTIDGSSIERWDASGEDKATCIAFEGFGLSFSLFIGRTPRFRPYRDDEHTAHLIRWYDGEDC